MDTQTQIDRLIELAIIQRSELKQLVEQLPQLREHLNAEVEKVFDETEPQLRAELEEWTTKQTADKTAALGVALEAKIADLAKSLEVSTQARYNAIIAERAENARLAAQAEAKIAEHAASLPGAVKEIVSAELARFPRAGEIDQLRKEFAEPKSLNPRGKWQAGETYNKLDLVTINGDSYTSNTDGNRTRPSRSSADWTLVAARGTGGGGGPTSLTELTTVPSDGDLLIGSGTSWVTSNLTAGAGISITVGPGAITISATDGDITLDDGTAASPSLHFTNDPDTGIYRPAANTLGISVSGTQVAYFDENGLTVPSAGVVAGGSFHGANGNANNPSFSFTSDQDTGFYRHGTNELGISIGGTEKAVMTSTTFSITPNVSTSGNLTVSGTTASTNDTSGAFQVIGGAGLKSSAYINTNGDTGRALVVGPVAQAGGNIPYASIKTSASFADFALGIENPNTTAGQGLGLRIVAGAAANDFPIYVRNQANNSTLFSVSGTGNGTLAGNLTVSGGTITGGASGMSLASGGTNQNITLTPDGTGEIVVAKPTASGTRTFVTIAETGSNVDTAQQILFKNTQQSWDQGAFRSVRSGSTANFHLDFIPSTSGSLNASSAAARLTSTGNLQIGGAPNTAPSTIDRYSSVNVTNVADFPAFLLSVADGTKNVRGSMYIDASTTEEQWAWDFSYSSALYPQYKWKIAGTTLATLRNNGNLILSSTGTDGGQKLQVDGTAAFTSTVTVASNFTISSNGFYAGGGTPGAGRLLYSATAGTMLCGQAGSTYDLSLATSGGTTVLGIPTGTTDATFAGKVTTGNVIEVSTGASTSVVRLTNTATGTGAGNGLTLEMGSGGTQAYLWNYENGTIQIGANNAIVADFTPANGIKLKGTTTNDSAAAGYVGEYVSSTVLSASAVSMTTGTATNITSISLTAGDWDVSGLIGYAFTGTTSTAIIAGSNSTSATYGTEVTFFQQSISTTTTNTDQQITIPTRRYSLSGTTTIYLIASCDFSAGTVGGYGIIQARRVR